MRFCYCLMCSMFILQKNLYDVGRRLILNLAPPVSKFLETLSLEPDPLVISLELNLQLLPKFAY